MSFISPPSIDVPLLTPSPATLNSPAPLAAPAAPTIWTTPPVILKVSDAVVAGAPLTINGGGINANTVDVAITLDTTGSFPATPPANALHPPILQIDTNNQFVVCTMPAGPRRGSITSGSRMSMAGAAFSR